MEVFMLSGRCLFCGPQRAMPLVFAVALGACGGGGSGSGSVPSDVKAYVSGASLTVGSANVRLYSAWVLQFTHAAILAGTAGSRGSADGTGTAARFYSPFGIANDDTNLYVTDGENHTVRRFGEPPCPSERV
jgi:hypothetical protein